MAEHIWFYPTPRTSVPYRISSFLTIWVVNSRNERPPLRPGDVWMDEAAAQEFVRRRNAEAQGTE